ncbi:uncharacterized protein [Panulirus ornatus]|uniref:uncharacterized protein n=1 Tax=Panulirus ornatus TaxID=150431 RepID=UPI003A88D202
MEEEREGMRELILEELARLGVQDLPLKRTHGQGSRLLGIPNPSTSSKSNRAKSKGKRSPRLTGSKSPQSRQGAGKGRDERKHTPKSGPKSPFTSAKRRAELRRQQNNKENKTKVFGRHLEQIPSVCVYMTDGIQVTVPEFLVDVCSLIRRNIMVEGIFRKAGSSQRQSDLKKLIDSGSSLPTSVHVVDGACLLKQFLRSLPDPILSSSVHAKIIKCMDLEQEAKIDAIVLCTLLLPQTHRSTLVYLMDFFSDVVAASGSNLMDARNLAIVLAPNLLSTTIMPHTTNRKSHGQVLLSEDAMLATNIEILQLLIENASLVCRMPSSVSMALEHQEHSQSTENLLSTAQPHPAARKKRRSASIHRLMTGLRRVVGHSRNDSASPLQTAGSSEELDTLHLHPGIALSPMPGLEISPRKRKSSDAFDLGLDSVRDPAGDTHLMLTPPSSKRAKVEIQVGTARSSATTPMDAAPSASNSLLLPVSTASSLTKQQSFKMGQSCPIREVKSSQNVLTQPSSRTPLLGDAKSSLKRSTSTKVGMFPNSPSTVHHTVHTSVNRRSLGRVESLRIEPMGHNTEINPLTKAHSQIIPLVSPVVNPIVRRRSCDNPIRVGAKRTNSFEEPVRVTRRSSIGWRTNHNEPDGADVSTLGPRGVPDGAECTLRDRLVPKPRVRSSIETLEQHYDDIKSVVKTMEDELDKSNVLQMKEVYFPDSSTLSAQNMSYSEMIQSAYERMKVETKDLGVSPSDNLSRRLGKELKIRNRRSEEHRVIRSPSERKIGTIRRRSRELVQNAAKSAISVESTPVSKSAQTPKMKGTLLQTPINASLRRGKPNSVKSGLPLVVRTTSSSSSESSVQHEESPSISISRRVVVNKRSDETNPRLAADSEISDISNVFRKEGAIEQSSQSINAFDLSSDERLMGSFLEQLPGPVTRRRSSLLSLMSSVPLQKLSFAETPHTSESRGEGGNSSIYTQHIGAGMNIGIDKKAVSAQLHLENKQNQSQVMTFPTYGEPEIEEQQWVSASDFIDCVKDQDEVTGEENVGRPSLAALIKQKKVTANVQLFNNLHANSPHQRQPHQHETPQRTPPGHSTASERRGPRLSYSKSMSHRASMTPRELLKTRQKSFLFDRTPHNIGKIAVVSPLKESTWINIQQEHSHETPKAYRGEATVPLSPFRRDEMTLKTMDKPVTFAFPHSKNKVPGTNFVTPTKALVNPPKLPPRASVRPSPIRIQYR